MLTIVVPIRNMEGRMLSLQQWLQEANSEAFQIIVVCNASTDNTFGELHDTKSQYDLKNLEVISSDILGAGLARQTGLENTTSEYILFWDSDDYGDIRQLNELLKRIHESSEMIICQYKVKREDTQEVVSPKEISGNLKSNLNFFARNPGLWRIVFKTDFVKNCKFGTSNMGEDQVFIADVLSHDPVIEFSDSVIYEYHLGVNGQLTSRKDLFGGISNSLSEIRDLVARPKCANLEAITVQFLSLAVTLGRKGSIKEKFEVVRHLFGFFFAGMGLEPNTSRNFRQKIITLVGFLKNV
jgi:glycosyltransferase involved in cell wall biosynthesis